VSWFPTEKVCQVSPWRLLNPSRQTFAFLEYFILDSCIIFKEHWYLVWISLDSRQCWKIFFSINNLWYSSDLKPKPQERSKMATRVQKQKLWAPRLQKLTEILEPHVAEIKQQGESKLWHPEPLARGKLLHTMLHWENWRAAGSKPAWKTFSRPIDEHQESHGIPPATPRINQHSPLGRLTPCPQNKQTNKQTEQ
jgi:hypothetical protein